MALTAEQSKTRKIIALLRQAYPDAHCALNFTTPLELLLATIMSAQCTDVQVNLVTEQLYRKYRSAEDFANAEPAELERDIKPTGFYRNKAKSLRGTARMIVDEYGGQVPQKMDDLLRLPGVARKTANVVLGNAFGIASGVVVDTHVMRLSTRLGLTTEKTPEKIEIDLQGLVPKKDWIDFSHLLIYHGRQVCKARNPNCEACVIEKLCPSSLLKQPA